MSKTTQQISGSKGEKAAREYLLENQIQILESNYRYHHAEIDIIGLKDDTLIFFEVKTRSTERYGYPEKFITNKQKAKIAYAAQHYRIIKNWKGVWRMDVLAVLENSDGTFSVTHLIDSF